MRNWEINDHNVILLKIGIIGVPHGFNNNDDFDIFPSIFAHDSIDF